MVYVAVDRCRTKNGTNVRKIRRRVLRYVAVNDI